MPRSCARAVQPPTSILTVFFFFRPFSSLFFSLCSPFIRHMQPKFSTYLSIGRRALVSMRWRCLSISYPGLREKPRTSSLLEGLAAQSDNSDELTCSPFHTLIKRSCVLRDLGLKLWQNLSKVVPWLVLGCGFAGAGDDAAGCCEVDGTCTAAVCYDFLFFFVRRHFFRRFVGASALAVLALVTESVAISIVRDGFAPAHASLVWAAAVAAVSFLPARKAE